MNVLLTNKFSIEGQEGKELINNITTSYLNQDKEAFLASKKPIAEAGFSASTEEEKEIFNQNVYELLRQLPENIAFALAQILATERRVDKKLVDVLGDSDDIFYYLNDILRKADTNEDIAKIKYSNDFFH